MKIGIIQGRLSMPTKGFQETPTDWENEFSLLCDLGLSHVEWVITKKSFLKNVFFHEKLDMYQISSVCADNLVTEEIHKTQYFRDNIISICEACIDNGVKNITIPLLEGSDMGNKKLRENFCKEILEIGKSYSNLNFSFEIENVESVISDIINMMDNFYLTYDTGNMTTVGVNHSLYIEKFINKINNVHLKDRDSSNKTVPPGYGVTNFNEIFSTLKRVKYDGIFTLQTAREKPGYEKETIAKHKKYLEKIYEESI